MPKRTRSHQLETLSRIRLHEAFAQVGWTVEDIDQDYGEDLMVRIFTGGEATAYTFFIQAKATDSLDSYMDKQGKHILFPVSTNHVKYWKQFWEPVILTVWDSKTDTTYWECIQTVTEKIDVVSVSTQRITIAISYNNKLDEEGIEKIRRRTISRYLRFERERDGAEHLIHLLNEKWGLGIAYDPQFGMIVMKKGTFNASPNGGRQITVFGRLEALLDTLARKYNISPQEMMLKIIEQGIEFDKLFMRGGKLLVKDASGNVLESWAKWDDVSDTDDPDWEPYGTSV